MPSRTAQARAQRLCCTRALPHPATIPHLVTCQVFSATGAINPRTLKRFINCSVREQLFGGSFIAHMSRKSLEYRCAAATPACLARAAQLLPGLFCLRRAEHTFCCKGPAAFTRPRRTCTHQQKPDHAFDLPTNPQEQPAAAGQRPRRQRGPVGRVAAGRKRPQGTPGLLLSAGCSTPASFACASQQAWPGSTLHLRLPAAQRYTQAAPCFLPCLQSVSRRQLALIFRS